MADTVVLIPVSGPMLAVVDLDQYVAYLDLGESPTDAADNAAIDHVDPREDGFLEKIRRVHALILTGDANAYWSAS